MTEYSYTYNNVRVPETTVTLNTDDLSITATCVVTGLNPNRSLSADEQLSGIVSLSPPQVVSTGGHQATLDLLISAAVTSLVLTDDIDFVPEMCANLAYAITVGYRSALLGAAEEFGTSSVGEFGLENL